MKLMENFNNFKQAAAEQQKKKLENFSWKFQLSLFHLNYFIMKIFWFYHSSLSFLQDNSNNFTSHSANDRSTSQQIRSAFVCRPSATAKVSFRIFS